jgi:hypothetical protein
LKINGRFRRYVLQDYRTSVPVGKGYCQVRRIEMEKLMAHMKRTGGGYSRHEHGGSCDICGNVNAMTHVIFYREKSNSYIRVGEICADKVGIGYDRQGFSLFKTALRDHLEAKAGKAKAEATLTVKGLQRSWAVWSHIDAARAAGTGSDAWNAATRAEQIISDIVEKLIRYGSLTEGQERLLRKLEGQIDEERAKTDARSRENAERAERSNHIGLVGERREFTATIRFTKYFDNEGGFNNHFGGGTTLTVLDDADGNVIVWWGVGFGAEKGETINFKATVKRHELRDGVRQTVVTRATIQPASKHENKATQTVGI